MEVHSMPMPNLTEIRPVAQAEMPILLQLIRQLAAYERRLEQVVASESDLERALLGQPPVAEAVLA